MIWLHVGMALGHPEAQADAELRGVWVTRWTYRNEADVRRIMTDIADARFNTVFFQVRGQHDAFYPSKIEPWAKDLTGHLGQDPGWDPLAVAVESGHAKGLKVHAYINAFTMWRGEAPPENTTPVHAWSAHGDWVVADKDGMPQLLNEGYVYASPGNPAVRARLAAVAKDIADRYEVDGIHLDHIRYPGPKFGYDMESMAAWEAAGRPDFSDWRRSAVNDAVRAVRDAVDVPVTAAVWGVYTNPWGWREVSEGRNAYFQDSAAFTEQGLVDALLPMTYWKLNPGGRLDFEALVRDHVARANGRHIYAGIRADPSWGAKSVVDSVRAARKAGAHGIVIFDYSEGRGAFEDLKSTVFKASATPPEFDWRKMRPDESSSDTNRP